MKHVYVLNLITGEVLNFESYNACVQWFHDNGFKLSITHLGFLINKPVDKKKQLTFVFNDMFLFSSRNDFVNWVNLDKYPEAVYLLPDKCDGFMSRSTVTSINEVNETVQIISHIKLYEYPVNQGGIIRKENKDYSGIYAWVNKLNNKVYVGSGVILYNRLSDYYSDAYLKASKNMLITKALKKYGMANFKLFIIEHTNTGNLIEREQYWIDILKAEYNTNPVAGNTTGYIHTLDTRLKIKEKGLARKITEETKEKMRLARLGYKPSAVVIEKLKAKIYTAEDRANLSKVLAGRVFTEEQLKKHTLLWTKLNGIKITITDTHTGNIEKVDSITLAASKLKATRNAIHNSMKKATLFRKRYQITKDS